MSVFSALPLLCHRLGLGHYDRAVAFGEAGKLQHQEVLASREEAALSLIRISGRGDGAIVAQVTYDDVFSLIILAIFPSTFTHRLYLLA